VAPLAFDLGSLSQCVVVDEALRERSGGIHTWSQSSLDATAGLPQELNPKILVWPINLDGLDWRTDYFISAVSYLR